MLFSAVGFVALCCASVGEQAWETSLREFTCILSSLFYSCYSLETSWLGAVNTRTVPVNSPTWIPLSIWTPALSVHILPSSTETVTSLHSRVPLYLIKEVLTSTVVQLSTAAQKNKGKSLDAEILFKVGAWEQSLIGVMSVFLS